MPETDAPLYTPLQYSSWTASETHSSEYGLHLRISGLSVFPFPDHSFKNVMFEQCECSFYNVYLGKRTGKI